MSTSPTPPIVSDAEIQAALAEAQAQATEIPSLDDGQGQHVVPIPVEPPVPPRPTAPRPKPQTVTPASAAPATAAPAPAAPVAPEQKRGWLGKLVWGLLGWLPFVKERSAGSAAAARPSLWTLLLLAIDRFLALVNRPFERLAPETRNLAGILALVTIVVSLAALYLLPWLSPPRDALSQLARQRAVAEMSLANAPPDNSAPGSTSASP